MNIFSTLCSDFPCSFGCLFFVVEVDVHNINVDVDVNNGDVDNVNVDNVNVDVDNVSVDNADVDADNGNVDVDVIITVMVTVNVDAVVAAMCLSVHKFPRPSHSSPHVPPLLPSSALIFPLPSP